MQDGGEPTQGVGPFKLPPEIEAQRRRGLIRGIATVAVLFAGFMAVMIAWLVWRLLHDVTGSV